MQESKGEAKEVRFGVFHRPQAFPYKLLDPPTKIQFFLQYVYLHFEMLL